MESREKNTECKETQAFAPVLLSHRSLHEGKPCKDFSVQATD